ncbi:MAG TPA: malto-oligosyltrehalose synthase, partial [Candidatus Binatia bacterium]|nr:malto-oligosyltrehalose synthase [Candidatus Binatia bacterium]
TLGKDRPHLLELQSILTAIGHLPPRTEADPEKLEERRREKEIVKRRIATLYQDSAEVRGHIDSAMHQFNGIVGNPQSFDLLDGLIEAQPYRLAFWRVAGEEINYRRFFDINELAAIRTESPEVFQATHHLILRLIADGKVTGLRIDHPDGLRDPAAYFRQLKESQSGPDPESNSSGNVSPTPPLYIVAEKILSKGESLPADWSVSGTTGYDFLNQVNGLFVRRASRGAIDKIYSDFIGAKSSYGELLNSRKKMILLVSLASELNALSHRLDDISERNRHYRDFTLNGLTFALREVIACLPVYRTYADGITGKVSERDRAYIAAAVGEAKRRNPRTARAIFDFISDTLSFTNLAKFREEDRPAVVDFVMKFQQLTGPVMAKGVEDTAFYIYNRLISLNEVGGDPEEFGNSLESFHRQNSFRLKHWPHAMLTLSTHDTKRGEDARARIDVLSEIAPEWRAALMRWKKFNDAKKNRVDGALAPDRNDEYLFYQTLVGTWPPESVSGENLAGFRERIVVYMQKAIKEAKVHTSWVNPNEAYDRATEKFVREALDDGAENEFLSDFAQFQKPISYFGMINSLSQTLLKMTSPGVPDFYQGTELWDFSLVDPDNRRPVDFAARTKLLDDLKQRERENQPALLRELLHDWPDGRIKLYLIYKSLAFRGAHRSLFDEGEYLPIESLEASREQICAFARRKGDSWVLVVVPRLIAKLLEAEHPPLGESTWGSSFLSLPDEVPDQWRNILTGEKLSVVAAKNRKRLPLAHALQSFPVALLSPVDMLGAQR